MPKGQPYQVVRQDEDDDFDSLTMTTSFIQGQDGYTDHHTALPGIPGISANGQPPRWARSRAGSRSCPSSIKFLLCPTKARTALSLALFTLLLGLAFWTTTTKKTLALPPTPPAPEPLEPLEPPEPNESIFKVSFARSYADHDTYVLFFVASVRI